VEQNNSLLDVREKEVYEDRWQGRAVASLVRGGGTIRRNPSCTCRVGNRKAGLAKPLQPCKIGARLRLG
jgi:hypothetical protein